MKTRRFALCLATVFLVAIYINIQRSHTFTLSNDEGTIKTEQIQPLWAAFCQDKKSRCCCKFKNYQLSLLFE